jgi:hemoglobin-like flavoprotein
MALQIDTLERSFDLIAPRGEELMDIFYARVFEIAPEAAPLFIGTDMAKQKEKLLSTLVLLRQSLRDIDAIVPSLKELGARHLDYGVAAEHYPVVGAALLWAMSCLGGADWAPEFTAAWSDAYAAVQSIMLSGAEEASRTSASA